MFFCEKTIIIKSISDNTAIIPEEKQKDVPEFEKWNYEFSHHFNQEQIGKLFLLDYQIDLIGNVTLLKVREYKNA